MSRLVKLFDDSDIMVSELKKNFLLKIVDKAKEFDFIDKLILFGSCLEERCCESSDIDLVIVGNKPRSKCLDSKKYREFTNYIYRLDFSQDYDFIYAYKSISSIKGNLLMSLESTGVCIYDKK